MPKAIIKVGDKIKLTSDVAGYDAGTEVQVTKSYADEGTGLARLSREVCINDIDGNDFYLTDQDYAKVKVMRKSVPEVEVVVPTAKIKEHEIIGQDINKDILQKAIAKDLPVLLIGETGTGKTSIIREQALDQGKEVARFSITGETTVDEFVGKYELENGQTVWRDGMLLEAMKKGKWLVVDEVNVALPEILFVLHSLLDDDHFVTVSNHNNEVVKPHKDFRFFATMNPPEEYAGTKELNKAFQSRFAVILTLHYPPAKIEAKIISDKTGVSLTDATKMADVGVALRKAKNDEKIFYTCSTRDLLHWGNLCDVLDPGEAFRVSILNKAGTEAEAILEIYSHIIKRYITLEQPSVQLTVDWFEAEAQKIVDERKQFENEKAETRRQITQEIIAKLTSPAAPLEGQAKELEKMAETPEPSPVNAEIDEVFSGNF